MFALLFTGMANAHVVHQVDSTVHELLLRTSATAGMMNKQKQPLLTITWKLLKVPDMLVVSMLLHQGSNCAAVAGSQFCGRLLLIWNDAATKLTDCNQTAVQRTLQGLVVSHNCRMLIGT